MNLLHLFSKLLAAHLSTIQLKDSTTSFASFHASFFKEIPLSCTISFPRCTQTWCVYASSVVSSCSARDMLFPELCSHQPPTEPHTPHGPRLPGSEMLPEQMYRYTRIIRVQTHSTNTHTRQSISHMPIFKPGAAYSSLSQQQIQCHISNPLLKL